MEMFKLVLERLVIILNFMMFGLPQHCFACAVCFGSGSANLSRGFYWGILILLLLPVTLFAIIASKIYLAVRRKSNI